MRSYGWLTATLIASLAACSGGGGATSPGLPAGLAGDALARGILAQVPPSTGVWGQVVHAVPDTLSIDLCTHATGEFDALENFEGDITAVIVDPKIAAVTPDLQRNHVIPTQGGLKNAWFTVIPLAAGATTITVRDKKDNTDTVSVAVVGCPTPTPSPSPTPGRVLPPATPSPTPAPTATPAPTPTPTASSCPTTSPASAGRAPSSTRRTSTGTISIC